MLHGQEVIVSVLAVKDGEPITVRRSWRERLLGWPWRPWVASIVHIPKVPAAYRVGDKWLVHPSVFEHLKHLSMVGEHVQNPDVM